MHKMHGPDCDAWCFLFRSPASNAQAAGNNGGSRPASRAAPADGITTVPFVDSSIRDALCSSTNRLTGALQLQHHHACVCKACWLFCLFISM